MEKLVSNLRYGKTSLACCRAVSDILQISDTQSWAKYSSVAQDFGSYLGDMLRW